MSLLIIFIDEKHFKKGKGKPFEFHNFSEVFYCGMTRLRNMNVDVFIQCQYTKTISRKKDMGQSLVKTHSKFQDEIFYCDMTRLKNTIFIYCGLYRYVKVVKQKKVFRLSFQESFKISKFQYSIKLFTMNGQRSQIVERFQKIYLHKSCCKKENYKTSQKMVQVSWFQ